MLAPHWLWLIGGVLLCVAEIIAPGFFLVWLGAAALVTGAVTLTLGIASGAQFTLFAGAAVALVLIARKYVPYHSGDSTDPLLNNRAARLIGQTVMVSEAVTASGGRVVVGDGAWPAKGCDAAAGTHVRIIGTEGNTLIVETA